MGSIITHDRDEPWTDTQLAEPLVAVLGVGYIGRQLVVDFSKHYAVIGYDVSEGRARDLQEEFKGTGVRITTRPHDLETATHFLVAVPTTLKADRSVDTSCIQDALAIIEAHARPRSTVVIESSVAVGTTRALLGPIAKQLRLHGGMSPERVDPGRSDPPPSAIPKIISGLDAAALAVIHSLYAPVFDTLVPVSSPEVAEMTKLYENGQRIVNIAYANEMADACRGWGVDAAEVCSAAATKPFGYLPVTPGVGMGGHCLPVNAVYLTSNNNMPLLAQAAQASSSRPTSVARRVLESLKASWDPSERLKRPRVLVVGIAYKKGQQSIVKSPGLEVADALSGSALDTGSDRRRPLDVWWADSLVPQSRVPHLPRLDELDWTSCVLQGFDYIVVSFLQDSMDATVLYEINSTNVMRY